MTCPRSKLELYLPIKLLKVGVKEVEAKEVKAKEVKVKEVWVKETKRGKIYGSQPYTFRLRRLRSRPLG